MNQHKVTLVDSKQLSDGQLALGTHCCDDPSTKSYLTLAASVVIDPVQRQEAIDFHVNRVATLHESMVQAKAKLAALLGTSTVVTLPAPAPAVPATPVVAVAAA